MIRTNRTYEARAGHRAETVAEIMMSDRAIKFLVVHRCAEYDDFYLQDAMGFLWGPERPSNFDLIREIQDGEEPKRLPSKG